MDNQFGTINIKNSYNIGNVNANTYQAAGIIAYEYANTVVENCYNLGEISQLGSSWVSYATAKGIGGNTIINCYNFGKIISERTKPNVVGVSSSEMKSCYYNSESSGMTQDLEELTDVKNIDIEDFVNLLNKYKGETGIYPKDWKKWKVGDEGYPIFE